MVFLVPEGNTEYWVDNWVIPKASEHPVAAHKWIDFVLDPVNAGKEMNYHQYPVPVEGIKGVEPDLANDPVINIPDEKIQGYESQLETAKGLQQRNRVVHGVQGRLTMAVADATPEAPPAAAPSRGRGRVAGALLGLALLAVAVAVYTQIGNLGLGLAPAVALLLVSVPVFVLAGAGDPPSDRGRQGGAQRATRCSSRSPRWRTTARSSSSRWGSWSCSRSPRRSGSAASSTAST